MFFKERHCFKANKSTITVILDLLQNFTEIIDSREDMWMLCSDLYKTFDTVNNGILLQKMTYRVVRDHGLKLIENSRYIEGGCYLVACLL